jgi:hypothetical protein
MWHAWERREKYVRYSWEILRKRDHLEDQCVGGRLVSECILGRLVGGGGGGVDSTGSG